MFSGWLGAVMGGLLGIGMALCGYVAMWVILDLRFRDWKRRSRNKFWADYYSTGRVKKRLTPWRKPRSK